MVATPNIRVTQGEVLTLTDDPSADTRVTQGQILAIFNYPTEAVHVTQAQTLALTDDVTADIRVTQGQVLAVVRGRIDNPRLRAWTYTIDGHDMYVLRLGDDETLVYDTYSEQWSVYASNVDDVWRANTGINWLGAEDFANDYGSNILVGDDVYGLLWFLSPEQGFDDHPDAVVTAPQAFTRVVMGQLPLSGRDKANCFQVFLDCDVGAPSSTGTAVTLETSDDAGHNFDNQGAVTITLGDYSKEVFWSSLGQMRAPGRLFKLTDDGAITTIFGLDLRNGDT